jgi:hypothetical protein
MIEFHLSQTLAKDLDMHLAEPRSADPGALQWYAHRVTIARRKCVIAIELQSRYAMVFCGLTKTEFEYFPEIFQDRLWREVISICELDDDNDIADMSELVLNLSVEQHYATGSNRSVQSHLRQVADELAWMVDNDVHRLPISGSEAFAFGLSANEMLRSTREHKDYFQPLVVFRDFWLGLIKTVREQSAQKYQQHPKPLIMPGNSGQDNVIRVDFTNRKKL